MTAIDLCICTFRRPHIAETLRSVARLALEPDWRVRVIVADNDDTPSARALVEQTAAESGLAVTYLHAPARNISIARNACLAAATAPLLAFIDDDELATPGWLAALLAELAKSGADAVLGPVQALYPAYVPAWLSKADFHSTRPAWIDNRIETGYTCNVIFRRTVSPFENLRFREELGRSGGEDTVFFATAHQRGAQLAYAPDAVVTEEVTQERARFRWLLQRRFRAGQTHAMLARNYAKTLLAATVKILICYAAAAVCLPRPDRARYWLLRGTLHLGVVCRLLGKRGIEQYG